MSRPIYHYYHVYADGDWLTSVDEHIKAMNASAFDPDLFVVGAVGSPENRREAIAYLTDAFLVDMSMEADEGWEQFTLNALHYEARFNREPFYVLYAHTKGAAGYQEINEYWRKVMTKHAVTNWRDCVDALDDGYYATGAFWNQYMAGQTPYFAGNFWWARSEAIAELDPCPLNSRYEAEVWIGSVLSKFNHPVWCTHNSILSIPDFKRAL